MASRALTVQIETLPLARVFTISRGAKTAADVVVATITEGNTVGRGECVPYARYGESLETVIAQIRSIEAAIQGGADRMALLGMLPPGAARNAVDCALWDLEAQLSGASVLQDMPDQDILTAYTIPYESAESMHALAVAEAHRPLLKIKLGAADDLPRLEAVRSGAPDADLIVDANEGWTLESFDQLVDALVANNVTMVEQPLPAGQDAPLQAGTYPFLLCADESCHDRASLPSLVGRYDMVNIKLDKTGGLTEALALYDAARDEGYKVMVGCMVASSLAMAPALPLAAKADIVDLDGPLLLAEDRAGGLTFNGSYITAPKPALWGG